MKNKQFNKIRSVIFNVREGKYTKEEGFDKIVEIMDIYKSGEKKNE